MRSKAADRYRQVQSQTFTPGELLLALYDGLFRFMNSARLCFENKQDARGREFIVKAHAIVSELMVALDHNMSPELCGNLASIYDFSLAKLNDANRYATTAPIDDAVRALTPLREAWKLAVPKAQAEASAAKEGG